MLEKTIELRKSLERKRQIAAGSEESSGYDKPEFICVKTSAQEVVGTMEKIAKAVKPSSDPEQQ